MSSYKDKHSIEERKSEASRIRIKYPERIPVIVEKGKNCTLNAINKQIHHGYYRSSEIYGDGFAGKKIAEVLCKNHSFKNKRFVD